MAPGSIPGKPSYVSDLEKSYGLPSQAAFGSAVFFNPVGTPAAGESLEQQALGKYQYFCGETWERFGPANWLGTWEQVYARGADTPRDIVAELRSIADSSARLSASVLLDNVDHAAEARAALARAFDDPEVAELQVFKIGDGGAMSGLLVASLRPADGALLLVFLLD